MYNVHRAQIQNVAETVSVSGLNQLLWYFADLEKQKCYILPNGDADWDNSGDACMKWRRFGKYLYLVFSLL